MKVLSLVVLLLAVASVQASLIEGPEIPAFKELYGYIPVNPQYDANLFYWMFESQSNPSTDPLVLWLTGGPGCSSELAIFFENGPWKVDPNTLQLTPNPYGWNAKANLLYVDQPAGTGFSYANQYYINNETMVAVEMYTFLQNFLAKYPQYRNLPFYITGESYAGHYIPAITAYIVQQNQDPHNVKINLKAVAIGDGLIDTVATTASWGPFLYGNGLIGQSDLANVQAQFYQSCLPDIQSGNYEQAFYDCNTVLQIALQAAGNINVYDVRKQCTYPPLCYNTDYITRYLNQAAIRKKLGVGDRKWSACNFNVYTPFETKDFEYSYRFDLPKILAGNTRVLVYNGNYDLIVDFYGTSAMLDSMNWSGQSGFLNAKNTTWHVGGQVAGSSRAYNGLTYLVVNNAGHMVPHDQPKNALDMLTRFIANTPFN